LFEHYNIGAMNFNHFDLYRFQTPEEWLSAGFNEYINEHDITIIEWPEKADGILCSPDIEIEMIYDNEISRTAFIRAKSKKGEVICRGLV